MGKILTNSERIMENLKSQQKIKWQPGMKLTNANGDVDPSSLGYRYAIQTTTFIRAEVLAQKFFTLNISDYFPVVVGIGKYMEEMVTNYSFDIAGKFESGDINSAEGPSQIAQVNVGLSPKTVKFRSWVKGFTYTEFELQKAVESNNWQVLVEKARTLKRNWDLGIQRLSFLGHESDSDLPGFLTSPEVTINTDTITKPITNMTDAEFQTFVANVYEKYRANSNRTAEPSVFAIPEIDYNGLAKATSDTFPIGNKINYLRDSFIELTGNSNFKILKLAYAQASLSGGVLSKDRYALYNNNPETVRQDIPMDLMMRAPGTSNNFQWENVGTAQYGSTIFYRPKEALYFEAP